LGLAVSTYTNRLHKTGGKDDDNSNLQYSLPNKNQTHHQQSAYLDSWTLQKRYDEGHTSGFDEYVSDPTAELTTRIDHVFLSPDGYRIEKVKSIVVGDNVKDMTPNGLWPSDHAGVVAKIRFSQKHK